MSAIKRILAYRRRWLPSNWLERALVERGAVLAADAVLVPEKRDERDDKGSFSDPANGEDWR